MLPNLFDSVIFLRGSTARHSRICDLSLRCPLPQQLVRHVHANKGIARKSDTFSRSFRSERPVGGGQQRHRQRPRVHVALEREAEEGRLRAGRGKGHLPSAVCTKAPL